MNRIVMNGLDFMILHVYRTIKYFKVTQLNGILKLFILRANSYETL